MSTQHSARKTTNFAVSTVKSDAELQEVFAIRLEVFVAEQLVPLDEEIDALDSDPTTTHILVSDPETGRGLATARLLPTAGEPRHFHIGRVAVRADARGLGLGAVVMDACERVAVASFTEGEVAIDLSAQIQASGFYRRIGYEQVSDKQYLDAGILHVDMSKTLRCDEGSAGANG